MDAMSTLKEALLLIADNIAKHIIIRQGYSPDDACFQVDLQEAEKMIQEIIREEIAKALREQLKKWRDFNED
jgi:hypothetical protein